MLVNNVKQIYYTLCNLFKRNKPKLLKYILRGFKVDFCRYLNAPTSEEDQKYLSNQKFNVNMKVVLNNPSFHI